MIDHYIPKIQLKKHLDKSQREFEFEKIQNRIEKFSSLINDVLIAGGLFNFSKKSRKEFIDILSQIKRDKLSILPQANLDQNMGYLFMELDNLDFRASKIVKKYRRAKIRNFLKFGFPKVFRKNVNLFLVSSLLFFIPFFLSMILTAEYPDQMYSIFGSMWKEPPQTSEELQPIISALIIQNNINVALLMFGLGFLLGIVTIFLLIYNGLAIGYAVGYVLISGRTSGVELAAYLLPHGFIEIPVIIIAGASGLKLAYSATNLIFRKIDQAVENAKESLYLFCGVFLLVFAGIIEGYFSFTSRLSSSFGIILRIIISFVILFCLIFYLMQKEEKKEKLDLDYKKDTNYEIELYRGENEFVKYSCDFYWSYGDKKSYFHSGKLYLSSYRLILIPAGVDNYFEIFIPFVKSVDLYESIIHFEMIDKVENLFLDIKSKQGLSNIRKLSKKVYKKVLDYLNCQDSNLINLANDEVSKYQKNIDNIFLELDKKDIEPKLKKEIYDEFNIIKEEKKFLESLISVN